MARIPVLAWLKARPRLTRALVATSALVAVLAIAMLSIGRAVTQIGSGIISGGNLSGPGFFFGDAYEPLYHWWVWLHQTTRLSSPYVDPFSFGALVDGIPNQMGWPYAPLFGIFLPAGPEFAYNVVLLATYPLTAGATFLWLRSAGIGRVGAAGGGLLFAFFPPRVMRLEGHYVAWLVVLVPLALWMVERAARGGTPRSRALWSVGFVVTLITIVQCGEFYVALFGTLICASYAALRLGPRLVRERCFWVIGGGFALAIATAMLMRWWFLTGSYWAGGRPLYEAATYSPRQMNFFLRNASLGSERFTYIGIVGLLAIPLGLIAGWRRRLVWFWVGWGIVIGVFSLGTATPVFGVLHEHTPFISFARSVTRPLPLAGLALALLAALAIERGVALIPGRRARLLTAGGVIAVVAAITAWDASVVRFTSSSTDGLRAQHELLAGREGAVLSAPVFDVANTVGVAYMYATIFDPRKSANGYSPYTPRDAVARQRALAPLDCGIAGREQAEAIRRYGIRLAVHYPMYYGTPASMWPAATMSAAFDRMPGVRQIGRRDDVAAWSIDPDTVRGVTQLPAPALPATEPAVVPCTGWATPGPRGRFSTGGDAFLWALRNPGDPPLRVRLNPGPVRNVVAIGVVDGPMREVRLDAPRDILLPAPATGSWTAIIIRPRRAWKRVPGQPESYGVQIRYPLPQRRPVARR